MVVSVRIYHSTSEMLIPFTVFRDEALKSFRTSPFFGVWDPAVLDIYVECGLYDLGRDVRLKMPGIQVSGWINSHYTAY